MCGDMLPWNISFGKCAGMIPENLRIRLEDEMSFGGVPFSPAYRFLSVER